MVTNELSDAVRKLDLTFNKKIEDMIGIGGSSFSKSESDIVSHNVEASDSIKAISPDGNERGNLFSWVRKIFFGK